jgi:hypothetical protein
MQGELFRVLAPQRGRSLRLSMDPSPQSPSSFMRLHLAPENDPLGLLRREIPVQVGQHDGGAALGEHARRRQPHAFGGARDQS